ncbi:MAG: hypothetical protein HQ530_02900 [Parcubacteria group bacterium]|nr:hypothetical protein [Parcubacteria group bacterium]
MSERGMTDYSKFSAEVPDGDARESRVIESDEEDITEVSEAEFADTIPDHQFSDTQKEFGGVVGDSSDPQVGTGKRLTEETQEGFTSPNPEDRWEKLANTETAIERDLGLTVDPIKFFNELAGKGGNESQIPKADVINIVAGLREGDVVEAEEYLNTLLEKTAQDLIDANRELEESEQRFRDEMKKMSETTGKPSYSGMVKTWENMRYTIDEHEGKIIRGEPSKLTRHYLNSAESKAQESGLGYLLGLRNRMASLERAMRRYNKIADNLSKYQRESSDSLAAAA